MSTRYPLLPLLVLLAATAPAGGQDARVPSDDAAPRFRPAAATRAGDEPSAWLDGFSLGPGVGAGTVSVFAVDGDDVFVGGLFQNAGGVAAADYVARYNRAENTWYALGSGLNAQVYDIAIDGDDVYVGGLFHGEAESGRGMTYVGRYDRTTDTWHPLGDGLTVPDDPNYVQRGVGVVELIDGEVWVGGYYVNAGGIAEADVLAIWDPASETWASVGQIYTIDPYGETLVYDVEPYGDDVYVHCYCAMEGDVVRHGIYENGTWTGLPVISDEATTQYASPAIDGDDLVLVRPLDGFIGLSGVPDSTHVVRYDGTGYTALPGRLPDRSSSPVVTIVDGEIVVGLGTLGGERHPFVMRHDGEGWVEVGPRLYSFGVSDVQEIDGELWAGGYIISLLEEGEIRFNGMARFDGSTWQPIGPFGNGLSGASIPRVEAVAVWSGDLYVGGSFENASGDPAADNVARWTGAEWEAVGDGLNRRVFALLPVGDRLYAGGDFFDITGQSGTRGLAQFDGTAWAPLAPDFVKTGVEALAMIDADLYVGGGFYEAAGVRYATNIARWDGDRWYALTQSGGGDNPSDDVTALLVDTDGTLLVGGAFSDVYGYGYLARWNPEDEAWGPIGDGAARPNADVYALAHGPGGEIYVGGAFSGLGGADGNGIAMWDGATWQTVGGGLEGHPDFSGVPTAPEVRTLYLDAGDLYVGGDFLSAGGVAGTANLARWDGAAWHPLSSGLDGGVEALGAHESLLWVGGSFEATADDARVSVHVGAHPLARTIPSEPDASASALTLAVLPNPTAGAARVRLAMPAPGAVAMALFDALGRRVAVLFEDAVAEAVEVALPGGLPAGVYHVRVRAAGAVASAPVTVVR